jgi:glycosyltransferase involved in cell wall biosynthesis
MGLATIPHPGTSVYHDLPVAGRQTDIRVWVILPVIDETTSLRKTVDILLAENSAEIERLLIVTCRKSTAAALSVCRQLAEEHPSLIEVRCQRRPFLGGAMRDAFEWAAGSHVLMMASDLETDPATVKDLISAAREGYDIVTATRWKARGGFHGYNPVKHCLNLIFQKGFGLFYGTPLSDLTYGFRIFKTEWVKKIEWEELRHAFLLETILKPMRLGASVAEVPTVWRTRMEGISHNQLMQHFAYFRIGLKTRFRSRYELLARSAS